MDDNKMMMGLVSVEYYNRIMLDLRKLRKKNRELKRRIIELENRIKELEPKETDTNS